MAHKAPSLWTSEDDATGFYNEVCSRLQALPGPDPEAFAVWIASQSWLAYDEMVAAVLAYCAAVGCLPYLIRRALAVLEGAYPPTSSAGISYDMTAVMGFRESRPARNAAYLFAGWIVDNMGRGPALVAIAIYCAVLGADVDLTLPFLLVFTSFPEVVQKPSPGEPEEPSFTPSFF